MDQPPFITKDSGERQEFTSGMVRDTGDKARYDLVYLPLITRWAELMQRGAKKYGERNWEKASGQAELQRFKASAWRHFISAITDVQDGEDHFAATLFNLGAILYLKEKVNGG